MNKSNNYDTWHLQYAETDDTQSVWHKFVIEQLEKNPPAGGVMLEIGCGRGGLSNYISQMPHAPSRIYACDYSEEALNIARKKYADNAAICWQRENIQALSFSDAYFDCIVSCETIEHVPNPKQAIQELYRVLKPGGKLYLTCPNYFNFFGLWCLYRYFIGKPYTEFQPYVNYILLPRLRRWIRNAGFKITHFRSAALVFPLRAHYRFYESRMPSWLSWMGLQTCFVLEKNK
jgi:ubiquinone/menaquinone biosynthesis C-methylase UbiE